jgi:hypothetical protein
MIGSLLPIVTFPGIILHEFAHHLVCDLTKTPVYQVMYLQFSEDSDDMGYVISGTPQRLRDAFLLSFCPLFLNSLLCMVLTLPFALKGNVLGGGVTGVDIFLEWLGISMGMHAIPSVQDARSFFQAVEQHPERNVFYLLSKGFIFFFKIVHVLRFFLFDLFFAVLLSCALPYLLYGKIGLFIHP